MNPSPASVRLRAPGEPRVLGVLGGMGPLATARFYDAVVRATPAGHDQGHIPTVIWSDPRIPDRTAAILAGGPSPVPAMVDGARKLETAGAETLAIPCNTAHAFLPELRASTRLVWIDMVGETLDLVARSGAERSGWGSWVHAAPGRRHCTTRRHRVVAFASCTPRTVTSPG